MNISIPSSPVPALEFFNATVVYSQDQNAQFARQDTILDGAQLSVGDSLTFNGISFLFNSVLSSPTDFTSPTNFVEQFNSNPDFNTSYKASVLSGVFGKPDALDIRIIALDATTQLNIIVSRKSLNAGAIEFGTNIAGASRYSKNDIRNFAQLARIVGTNSDNEQVSENAGYVFELSSQIQSQLEYFDIANGNGSTMFYNNGSYKDLQIEFGTRFSTAGSSYRSRVYTEFRDFFTYLGKEAPLGLLTNRTGSKISSTELYELDSFLIYDLTSTATLTRSITIEYTDSTSTTAINGTTSNNQKGIISVRSDVNSFSSLVDNSKVIKSWTVNLADSAGNVLYQGQKYINEGQPCINYFQVLYTNEYGGFEVATFKTDATNSFNVDSQEAKQATSPNQYKEFNFVTDTSEIISMDEQAITEKEYTILKALPQSKYTYVIEGNQLKPVRLTAFELNQSSFNANFKCLEL